MTKNNNFGNEKEPDRETGIGKYNNRYSMKEKEDRSISRSSKFHGPNES